VIFGKEKKINYLLRQHSPCKMSSMAVFTCSSKVSSENRSTVSLSLCSLFKDLVDFFTGICGFCHALPWALSFLIFLLLTLYYLFIIEFFLKIPPIVMKMYDAKAQLKFYYSRKGYQKLKRQNERRRNITKFNRVLRQLKTLSVFQRNKSAT